MEGTERTFCKVKVQEEVGMVVEPVSVMGRADHDIIISLIRAMKREIAQVRRNVERCFTIQQPSRSSVVAENNMIGSWLPGCGGAISLSALRTRCWGLLISDKPKHQASLGSVSLNTACLTTT